MTDIDVFDEGERIAKIGFITVAILGLVKGIVGVISSSVSLSAQALDSLTDLVSLVAVYMGLKISRKPPSDRFSYGYYRVETMVSLLISIIILITGGFMLMESWSRVFTPIPIKEPLMVFGVTLVSIPVLLWLGRYTKKIGVDINSQAVQSQSEDFMTDVYSSLVVLFGVTGSWLSLSSLEGISGVIISLLIVKTGIGLSWNSVLVLMDAVENPDKLFEVQHLAESVHGVVEVKGVRMRRSGPFCFGELTIMVGEELDVEKAHRLSHTVEDTVKAEVSGLESLVVHIEPVKREKHRIAVPIDVDKGLGSEISPHFGTAKFFIFIDLIPQGIQSWFVKPNHLIDLEKKRGIVLSETLLEEKITTVISNELGEGPFYMLRDNYVTPYRGESGLTVREVIALFLSGKLKPVLIEDKKSLDHVE